MILVTKTSDQTRQRGCVSVFIKLHITAQPGLVILVILCHSHRSSQGGSIILIIKKNVCVFVCVCVYVCVCIY